MILGTFIAELLREARIFIHKIKNPFTPSGHLNNENGEDSEKLVRRLQAKNA
jgi:hypothetical protein